MPVPSTIDELDPIAGNNYPSGSDSPATIDNYLRAHAAFIAQLDDGKPDNNGTGASGTWGISISGNAATATNAANATNATTAANCSRSVTGAGLATGGGALTANQAITVTAASQAQAEAGTDNATVMTPLRTAQAIAVLSLPIGVGQTWQDVSGSRAHSTAYQNTTGRTIQVAIAADAIDSSKPFQVSSNNVDWVSVGRFAEGTGLRESNIFAAIPPGHYYRISGNVSVTQWAELR